MHGSIRQALVLGLVGLSGLSPVWAANQGKTAQGETFVMGGNADDEREAMREDRKKFNLWVQTGASAGSAPPQADVSIRTRSGQTVLQTRMNGPWLFVNLGLGEYLVAVSAEGITQTRGTFIHRGDHNEMVFFFDAPLAVPPVQSPSPASNAMPR